MKDTFVLGVFDAHRSFHSNLLCHKMVDIDRKNELMNLIMTYSCQTNYITNYSPNLSTDYFKFLRSNKNENGQIVLPGRIIEW